MAVSDIAKLATAIHALSLDLNRAEADRRRKLWGRSAGGLEHPASGGASRPVRGASSVRGGSNGRRTNGLGATGTVTTNIDGRAEGPLWP